MPLPSIFEISSNISIAEGKDMDAILQEAGSLRSLIQEKTPNPPQKAKQVLELLRQRRFPRLFDAEKRFQKRVVKLSLPKGVRIMHPLYFEGAQYRLEVLFRDGRELRRRLVHLSKVRDLEIIGDPWENEA